MKITINLLLLLSVVTFFVSCKDDSLDHLEVLEGPYRTKLTKYSWDIQQGSYGYTFSNVQINVSLSKKNKENLTIMGKEFKPVESDDFTYYFVEGDPSSYSVQASVGFILSENTISIRLKSGEGGNGGGEKYLYEGSRNL